jgi:hypothetical protein
MKLSAVKGTVNCGHSPYFSICGTSFQSCFVKRKLIPEGIYLSIYGSTALCWGWTAFQFLNLYTVGSTPWTGDQPDARPLLIHVHRTTQTQNKRTQTFMPLVGLEPTTPVFERTKTVHALYRAATVIGSGRDS